MCIFAPQKSATEAVKFSNNSETEEAYQARLTEWCAAEKVRLRASSFLPFLASPAVVECSTNHLLGAQEKKLMDVNEACAELKAYVDSHAASDPMCARGLRTT